ncbi:hypothetical protein PCANC_19121 [Puccinia coronata f. sp. avenae]|uniref:Uncharacterized protein n=1 Tax=Puccinia coronata f. sp. avenae TaxID=200324 RepID=A0A2N5SCL5_9BASI|nr:hypothetical protein PCANC_19121 [Puccinia coronata f. sp. avenae]
MYKTEDVGWDLLGGHWGRPQGPEAVCVDLRSSPIQSGSDASLKLITRGILEGWGLISSRQSHKQHDEQSLKNLSESRFTAFDIGGIRILQSSLDITHRNVMKQPSKAFQCDRGFSLLDALGHVSTLFLHGPPKQAFGRSPTGQITRSKPNGFHEHHDLIHGIPPVPCGSGQQAKRYDIAPFLHIRLYPMLVSPQLSGNECAAPPAPARLPIRCGAHFDPGHFGDVYDFDLPNLNVDESLELLEDTSPLTSNARVSN